MLDSCIKPSRKRLLILILLCIKQNRKRLLSGRIGKLLCRKDFDDVQSLNEYIRSRYLKVLTRVYLSHRIKQRLKSGMCNGFLI